MVPTPSTPVRLLLAGDSVLSSEGLRAQLEQVPDVDVVEVVDELEEISSKVKESDPDAVLISLRTHSASAMPLIHASRQLREEKPGLAILIISDRGNGFALELLRAGSARTAYLLDDQVRGIEDVLIALREVLSGQTVLDASVVDALVSRRDAVAIDDLTTREVEVLEQISLGLSNRTVATELRITVKAVENYVTAIFRKLGLAGRTDIHPRVAAAVTYLNYVH
jgi:DNA-binding NarL/FixJ family response regulator